MEQPRSQLPLIRVTQLESFRRLMSEDYPYVTEQSLIDGITGTFTGSEYRRIGTAFHSIVETGKPQCEKVGVGERTYTYYNKLVTEQLPCGRMFDIDGYKVTFDVAQCKLALDYRNEHPQAFHEIRTYKNYGNAIVTGCADMIDGLEIRDIKTKFSPASDSDYINSAQWRYYLELFGSDTFHFDLFTFEGYDLSKHGYDVRGVTLKRYEPAITCYRYDRLEKDNRELLDSYLEWISFRGLTKYFMKQSIS